MKLIYISSGDVSVLESQALELLKYYAMQGIDFLYLQGYRTEKEKEALKKKHEPYLQYFNPIWFRYYPCYRFFHNRIKRSIYNALNSQKGYEKAVIHARDEPMGAVLCQLKMEGKIRNPVLSEFRASGTIEMPYYIRKAGLKRKILSLFMKSYFVYGEKLLFNTHFKDVIVSSVSPTINNYFKNKYPLSTIKYIWCPNVAGNVFIYSNEDRDRIRKELGFNKDDTVVICATGSNARWQLDYKVVPYLVQLGCKIINLSKFKLEMDGVVTMMVPFQQMPAMLSAADAAVLWREKTMLNISASPSKLSEFAAMGLSIIHNGSVDVAIKYIKDTGNGFLLNDTTDINENMIKAVVEKKNNRQKIAEDGRSIFGIEKVASDYIKTYNELSDKSKGGNND